MNKRKVTIVLTVVAVIHFSATFVFGLADFLHGFSFGPEPDVPGYARFGGIVQAVKQVLVFPASPFFGPTRFWLPILVGNSLLWSICLTGVFLGLKRLTKTRNVMPDKELNP